MHDSNDKIWIGSCFLISIEIIVFWDTILVMSNQSNISQKIECLCDCPSSCLRPRSHYSVLVQNGEKDLRFCEGVHTDPHKNITKTEVFENAFKSEHPQKRMFFAAFLLSDRSV